MNKTYSPRSDSLAYKVLEFLRANPDEELDADGIAAKFACARASMHTLLAQAISAGLLARREDLESGELAYSLGAGAAAAPAAARPASSVWPAKPPRRQSPPFHIDLAKVRIEKDVPLQPIRGRGMDWTPLFAKLGLGDSFQLPAEAKSSITGAMKAFKDATGKELACRTVDSGIRVWRVA